MSSHSSVRTHFEFEEDHDQCSFVCKLCKKNIASQSTGTTSHLWSHLQGKHLAGYEQATQLPHDNRHWTCKRIPRDSIRHSIQIRVL